MTNYLLGSDWILTTLLQVLSGLWVVTEILLAANENDGKVGAEVIDLGYPLLLNIVERVGRVDGKANEDDVRVGIRQWTQSIVVFLASGIP